MKILTWFSRIFVGVLFIISGLIKANDPLGFSYKLHDYFEVFGMEFMNNLALPLAMFICIIEVVLGVATITGSKIKPVSWSLLLMITPCRPLVLTGRYMEFLRILTGLQKKALY